MQDAERVAVVVHPDLAEGVRAKAREVDVFRAAGARSGAVDVASAERSPSRILADGERAFLATMLRSLDRTRSGWRSTASHGVG